jgi:predicted nucleic acid-binding protein
MSLKIYIETTIPSFYFETRRTAECVSRRNWTRRWWDEHRREHELATSLVVRDELSDPKYPEAKRRNALALLDELPLLDIDVEVDEIVETYVANLLMPQQPVADAIHLAVASFYKCDVLLDMELCSSSQPEQVPAYSKHQPTAWVGCTGGDHTAGIVGRNAMKTNQDEAVAEVRAARKSLCDRFGNDSRRLLAHVRAEQKKYRGQIVKNWSELEPTAALRETPAKKRR